jgi:hypothetical protein
VRLPASYRQDIARIDIIFWKEQLSWIYLFNYKAAKRSFR